MCIDREDNRLIILFYMMRDVWNSVGWWLLFSSMLMTIHPYNNTAVLLGKDSPPEPSCGPQFASSTAESKQSWTFKQKASR
jgi:hypothetical protein